MSPPTFAGEMEASPHGEREKTNDPILDSASHSNYDCILQCFLTALSMSQVLTSVRSSRSAHCFSMAANKMQMAIPLDASRTSSKGGNVGARRRVRSYGSRP